ncbi:alpha/beta fold hydrolase [Candidatus Poribacteria bacterium]|nr:alpha/beta fold hydrolase [Candidatus Poribacteria bacterium]
MRSIKRLAALVVAIVLLVLLFSFYRRADAYRDSFDRRDVLISGRIPAQVYLPEAPRPPIVIVAHGFTADKEMMQSLAYSLLRDGFAVVTFDFRGHGQNNVGFDHNRLQEDMKLVVDFAKNLNERMPVSFGQTSKEVDTDRIAIMGHSMGGGAVVTYAFTDPDIDATVPISGISAKVTDTLPRNLFIIYAKNDPPDLHHAAEQMLRDSIKQERPAAGATYGSFGDGSARRLSMVKGTDHLTILFSMDAQRQMLDWLHQVWGLPPMSGQVSDPRLPWMGWMYVFSFLIFFFCCYGLAWYFPTIAKRTGRQVVLNLVAFTLVCFVTLFVITLAPPLSFIPMPVGDYLISYFFVVGVIFFFVASRRGNIDFAQFTVKPARAVFAAFALFILVYITLGAIATETWFRQFFTAQRLLWAFVIFPLLLPFFIAFEASFKRGGTLVAAVASLIGILIPLAMLVLGVRLGLTGDFIMLIVIPMTLYNIVFQLFSIYVYRLSGNYFLTALFHAMIMAWQYAVLFPIN